MLKRLTVHLTKVKKVREKTGHTLFGSAFSKPRKPVEETKAKVYNTISVHNLKSEADIQSALSEIRNNHKIAKCKKPDHKTWKVGDEMWYTSNESL